MDISNDIAWSPVLFLGTQISLADLQSLLSEMEGRNEAQAANIESLTATLNTKDDIINVIFLLVTQLHIMAP